MLDLNRNLTFRVSRVAQEFANQASHVLKKHSVFNLSEWRMMVLIMRAEVESAAELVELTRFDRALVSRSLKSLQQRQLLELKPNPEDGRRQIIQVTAAGKQAFDQAEGAMKRRQDKIMGQFSAEEMEVLFDALDRMHAMAQLRDFDE